MNTCKMYVYMLDMQIFKYINVPVYKYIRGCVHIKILRPFAVIRGSHTQNKSKVILGRFPLLNHIWVVSSADLCV